MLRERSRAGLPFGPATFVLPVFWTGSMRGTSIVRFALRRRLSGDALGSDLHLAGQQRTPTGSLPIFFLKNIRPKSSFDPCVLFPNFHIIFLYPKSFRDMFCCSHLTAPGQHCLHARIELSCKSHFYFGAWVRGNGE